METDLFMVRRSWSTIASINQLHARNPLIIFYHCCKLGKLLRAEFEEYQASMQKAPLTACDIALLPPYLRPGKGFFDDIDKAAFDMVEMSVCRVYKQYVAVVTHLTFSSPSTGTADNRDDVARDSSQSHQEEVLAAGVAAASSSTTRSVTQSPSQYSVKDQQILYYVVGYALHHALVDLRATTTQMNVPKRVHIILASAVSELEQIVACK